MGERKQRTPAEIIAETEEKLSRLRVKAAKKDALSDPSIAPLVAELNEARKDIREAKKGLGDGPQSFNARVAKHEVWIDKIETERAAAEETLLGAEHRKAMIEAEIANHVTASVASTTSANSAEA